MPAPVVADRGRGKRGILPARLPMLFTVVTTAMEIDFDPAKDAANIAKHGLSLARAGDLDFDAAAIVLDARFDEERYRIYGLLDGRPCCLAATLFGGVVRAISLRRAHWKEYDRHVR